ncbi:hypothetical protein Dacsa_0891 [Dactylococcopsis salina PCC 8305]|uniref:Uncharacterized protein n=1 Tax=Dactylococcopsis salina (strain PCC 8305) TaxID=13035 RepID=K9YRV2_DACS8|nr:hypothetical protein Dacsa_0891 [Dactylococcopsis salina PCC 8305]
MYVALTLFSYSHNNIVVLLEGNQISDEFLETYYGTSLNQLR